MQMKNPKIFIAYEENYFKKERKNNLFSLM